MSEKLSEAELNAKVNDAFVKLMDVTLGTHSGIAQCAMINMIAVEHATRGVDINGAIDALKYCYENARGIIEQGATQPSEASDG